jgi:hypothetical protein
MGNVSKVIFGAATAGVKIQQLNEGGKPAFCGF